MNSDSKVVSIDHARRRSLLACAKRMSRRSKTSSKVSSLRGTLLKWTFPIGTQLFYLCFDNVLKGRCRESFPLLSNLSKTIFKSGNPNRTSTCYVHINLGIVRRSVATSISSNQILANLHKHFNTLQSNIIIGLPRYQLSRFFM